MLELIREHQILGPFVRDACCENGVGVQLAPEIAGDRIVIVKVDDYYNSLNVKRRPASVDCLIIIECESGDYRIAVVELKDISSSSSYSSKNLRAKFETTLNDFMETRFPFIGRANIRDIRLYFVSNITNYRRDSGLMMDVYFNLRFSFQGRKLMITPRVPSPVVQGC